MLRALGIVLIVPGLGWASIGFSTCWGTMSEAMRTDAGREPSVAVGMIVILSGGVFVMPGLLVAGVGAIAARR